MWICVILGARMVSAIFSNFFVIFIEIYEFSQILKFFMILAKFVIFCGFDGTSDVDAIFVEKGVFNFQLQTTCMSTDK